MIASLALRVCTALAAGLTMMACASSGGDAGKEPPERYTPTVEEWASVVLASESCSDGKLEGVTVRLVPAPGEQLVRCLVKYIPGTDPIALRVTEVYARESFKELRKKQGWDFLRLEYEASEVHLDDFIIDGS